ncbi:SDR family oxidoreductase [Saccharopolyspora sp. ASAGF58]|nr:SDR family oxidoreductase [Saccharopolyspora sp. ASAGF58]
MSRTGNRSVAIVTGATSGIGHEIAMRLCQAGHQIVATGRSVDRGERLEEILDGNGVFVEADLAVPGAATDVVTKACEIYDQVDVVVNNAALDHTGTLTETPAAEIRDTFDVNTFAAIELLQAGARHGRLQPRRRDHQHHIETGTDRRADDGDIQRIQRCDGSAHQGGGGRTRAAGDPGQLRRPRDDENPAIRGVARQPARSGVGGRQRHRGRPAGPSGHAHRCGFCGVVPGITRSFVPHRHHGSCGWRLPGPVRAETGALRACDRQPAAGEPDGSMPRQCRRGSGRALAPESECPTYPGTTRAGVGGQATLGGWCFSGSARQVPRTSRLRVDWIRSATVVRAVYGDLSPA